MIDHTAPPADGQCPTCNGTFETCTCGIRIPTLLTTATAGVNS